MTFKNHRDFSPIQVRLARDPNIPGYVSRMHSATKNLQESLPIFFACAVLSIVMDVDSSSYGLAWIILRIIYPDIAPEGATTILVSIFTFGALNILAIGIVGEYIGKILIEVKQRPRLIRESIIRNGIIKNEKNIS